MTERETYGTKAVAMATQEVRPKRLACRPHQSDIEICIIQSVACASELGKGRLVVELPGIVCLHLRICGPYQQNEYVSQIIFNPLLVKIYNSLMEGSCNAL